MARLAHDPNGRKRVVVTVQGVEKTIRLGKVSSPASEEFRRHVQKLADCKALGDSPETKTRLWLDRLGDDMFDKLALARLVQARENLQLGAWLEKYLASSKVKGSSLEKLKQTKLKLVEFFGKDRPLRNVNADQASDWRTWLGKTASKRTGRLLTEATIKIHCGNAKQLFGDAARRKLIPESPFAHLAGGATPRDQDRHVTLPELEKILAVCPDAEWKLWFALPFFATVRVKSEMERLTWADVDFEKGRLHVVSPKTERFKGHERRTIPICPRLAELLQAQFDAAPVGTVNVLRRPRSGYTVEKMNALILQAGVEPWSDLFVTLRASGERYWQSQGVDVQHAAKMAGHSVATSQRHYVRSIPDEVQDRIAGKAARNAARQGVEVKGNETHSEHSVQNGIGVTWHETARYGNETLEGQMGDKGFEPLTPSV